MCRNWGALNFQRVRQESILVPHRFEMGDCQALQPWIHWKTLRIMMNFPVYPLVTTSA